MKDLTTDIIYTLSRRSPTPQMWAIRVYLQLLVITATPATYDLATREIASSIAPHIQDAIAYYPPHLLYRLSHKC